MDATVSAVLMIVSFSPRLLARCILGLCLSLPAFGLGEPLVNDIVGYHPFCRFQVASGPGSIPVFPGPYLT
jgi:hypothetical protein